MKRGICEKGNICCVQSRRDLNRSVLFDPGNNVDKQTSWVFCRNKKNCNVCKNFGSSEICLGVGSSTAPKCEEFYRSFFQSQNSIWDHSSSLVRSYHLTNASNGSKEFKLGHCQFDDGCCLSIKETSHPTNLWRCNEDICSQHINWVKTDSDIMKNYSTWKENKDIIHGRTVGGKLCTTLRYYALSLIVPMILNFMVTLFAWFRDYKNGHTHFVTLFLAILQFYPQWRVLRYQFSSNERKRQDIDQRNLNLQTLELWQCVFQVLYL